MLFNQARERGFTEKGKDTDLRLGVGEPEDHAEAVALVTTCGQEGEELPSRQVRWRK